MYYFERKDDNNFDEHCREFSVSLFETYTLKLLKGSPIASSE
jgi:hypothetical protein